MTLENTGLNCTGPLTCNFFPLNKSSQPFVSTGFTSTDSTNGGWKPVIFEFPSNPRMQRAITVESKVMHRFSTGGRWVSRTVAATCSRVNCLTFKFITLFLRQRDTQRTAHAYDLVPTHLRGCVCGEPLRQDMWLWSAVESCFSEAAQEQRAWRWRRSDHVNDLESVSLSFTRVCEQQFRLF